MHKKYSVRAREFVTKHPMAIYRAGLLTAEAAGVAAGHFLDGARSDPLAERLFARTPAGDGHRYAHRPNAATP